MQITVLLITCRDKSTESVLESAPPQLVRLANIDPLPKLSSDQVQQIETEIMNLTKSMSSCRDDDMRAVFLCRRGALLRKVCSYIVTLYVITMKFAWLHSSTWPNLHYFSLVESLSKNLLCISSCKVHNIIFYNVMILMALCLTILHFNIYIDTCIVL